MSFYKNKKILVTGGTGLIGQPLVDKLIKKGGKVRVVSLDDKSRANKDAEFIQLDLRNIDQCLRAVDGCEIVFHLAGVKGSPQMTEKQPASFFVPTILFNTNMMEAARIKGVSNYLFTSSIGVYSPAEIFYEDDVWKSFPSKNDKFAGWAKRMGELQADAYKIEYGFENVSIVRPANVYGPFDNFDPKNAMVIPSLIARIYNGENPLKVWGDGSAIRDFIYSEDVADGMMLALEAGCHLPINLGSGDGVSVKQISEILQHNFKELKIEWDISKPSGDKKRIMDTSRAISIGFKPKVSLMDGIKKTIDWYKTNQDIVNNRYNSFTEIR
jgi:GDP-L-fucose synthase